MNIINISGFEFLTAIADKLLPALSMTQSIPIKMDVTGKCTVKCIVKADVRHLNPLGGVHRGFAATVFGPVSGCAVYASLEARSAMELLI